MTDNFQRYKELITLCGGLPDDNEKGNLDRYYVVELMRRGKDNPDLPAANYHFRNYYIYSWRDLDRYEKEIKQVCNLLNLRAYCSVGSKRMSQVALDTLAESARRIAAHDYKRFYSIFESCSGKYLDRSGQLWVVDIGDTKDEQLARDLCQYIRTMESGYDDPVVYVMPTRTGQHIITRPFNLKRFQDGFSEVIGNRYAIEPPTVKKNHLTLLYENLNNVFARRAAREAENKPDAESIVTWTTWGGVTEADCDLIDTLTSEHAHLIVGLANTLRNNPADRVPYCYATEQLVAAADAMLNQWKKRTREPYDHNRMHVTICHGRYCMGRSATIDVVFQYGEKQDGE